MIKIALSMWRISGSAEVRPSREYQPDSLIPRFIMQVRLEKRPSIKIRANQVHRNGNHGPEPGLLRRPGRKMRAGPRVNSPTARRSARPWADRAQVALGAAWVVRGDDAAGGVAA